MLPEGVEHSILCTAPDDDRYYIFWVADRGPAGDGFVVEDEELDDGMKGIMITFIATTDISNTSLRCVVTDLLQASNSLEPIELLIVVQGFLHYNYFALENLTFSLSVSGILSAPAVQYYKGDYSILFIWSPPYSHNITDVEPDISHYLVNIINMEDHSVLTVNTTDTEYLLQSQDCQLTHYQVEIAAVNVVGVGDKYKSLIFSLEGSCNI